MFGPPDHCIEPKGADGFSGIDIVPRKRRRKFRRGNRGMMLVLMLAMIVLVTIAVMAFFTHATANRQVETSRSAKTEADILVDSGADYVTAKLLSEIFEGSTLTNSVFNPLSATNLPPQRAIGTNISATDTNFLNLLRQSISDASGHRVSDISRNGRSVGTNRWNAPHLIGGSGFTTNTELPCWIYVTRSGGVTNAPGTNVIGRFAYNVYDIGGLLDANIAGFPSSIGGTNIAEFKSSAVGADLSVIPGFNGTSGSTNIDGLVAFRSGVSNISVADYKKRTAAFRTEGFIPVVVSNSAGVFTNNTFTSRQDLIRYARTQGTNMTNALPYLTHFSRSLNGPTWQPQNVPGGTINYSDNKNNVSSINRYLANVSFKYASPGIVHYADDGTSESYAVAVGDPLIQRKFSLAKLAWIGVEGINSAAFKSELTGGPNASQRTAAVLATFGLAWNASRNRWDYMALGASPAPHIKTLDEVAGESREANFFELLKAAILEGSVGVYEDRKTLVRDDPSPTMPAVAGDQYDLAASKISDLQIFRIGASIIDCADTDNFPTVIGMNISAGGTVIIETAGVEDLPYLSYLDMYSFKTGVNDTTTRPPWNRKMTACDIVWTPEFFNPHKPSVPSATPAALKMEVMSGVLRRVGCNVGQNSGPLVGGVPTTIANTNSSSGYPSTTTFPAVPPSTSTSSKSLTNSPAITISPSQYANFRNGPQPARDSTGTSPSRLGTLVSYVTGNQDVQAVPIYSYQKEYTFSASVIAQGWGQNAPWEWWHYAKSGSGNGSHFITLDELVLGLSYQLPSGAWKVYSTFGGYIYDDGTKVGPYTGTGLSGIWNWNGNWSVNQYLFAFFPMVDAGPNVTDFSSMMFASKWDPRTSRLGVAFSNNRRNLGAVVATSTTAGTAGLLGLGSGTTTMPYATPGGPLAPGLRPQAGKVSGTNPTDGWRDFDSVFRPSDAFLGGNANMFLDMANNNRRPVILQRPYNTVAELGYVFRDLPWKSLSLFDETSADGALLDVFAVQDEPKMSSGKVYLNTRQPAALSALLGSTAQDSDGSNPLTSNQDIARTLATTYSYSAGVTSTNMPQSPASLVSFASSSTLTNAVTMDVIKWRREAVARALGESTQTRTWNVLIDIVAQVGRFPGNAATTAENFVVEGEARAWFSKAVDRYTGKVEDASKESVNE